VPTEYFLYSVASGASVRWYVTDGTVETDLPGSLKPATDAYLPPLDFEPFRPPGGTALHYEGDGLPRAGWFDLVDATLRADGEVELYQQLQALNAALKAATSLVRVAADGTITWPLSVGKSHLTGVQPVEGLSNVFRLGARIGVSSVLAGTVSA
jgi:hypothetical protein